MCVAHLSVPMLTMLLLLWNGALDGHFPWAPWADAVDVVRGVLFPVQLLAMSLLVSPSRRRLSLPAWMSCWSSRCSLKTLFPVQLLTMSLSVLRSWRRLSLNA